MLQRDVARELGVSPTRIQHLESRATRRLARKLWPRE
jgi:DNA-directed RNA polymerase specialized sigma subunit